MGFLDWVSGFSLPDNEAGCNALRTADTDPKPVQWNSIYKKCGFFVPTDEARLGMSKCTAGQMFDMSNNTCSEAVVDQSCGTGMFRPNEGDDCIAVPSSQFDQAALLSMGECGAKTSLASDGTTVTGIHSWIDGSCSLSCNEGFTLNETGDLCSADCPDGQELDSNGVCQDISGFTNKRGLSDRDVMILIILVVLIYIYRNDIKQALKKST